jgi:hypothetical protein
MASTMTISDPDGFAVAVIPAGARGRRDRGTAPDSPHWVAGSRSAAGVFPLTWAIVDDLGAIVVIAVSTVTGSWPGCSPPWRCRWVITLA